MVLKQATGEILMIVEDKLDKDPTEQLRRYSLLFPESLDIWFLGCRVADQGGLEFMLAYRDRTRSGARLRMDKADTENGWYQCNSADFLRKMRDIAEINWKDADFYPSDPTV